MTRLEFSTIKKNKRILPYFPSFGRLTSSHGENAKKIKRQEGELLHPGAGEKKEGKGKKEKVKSIGGEE